MKDKILETLKTKYSSLGLSKEVLDGFADYLASSITEETGIEDGIAKIENLLKIQQKEFDKIRMAKKKAEEEKTTPADESPKKNTVTRIEQKTEPTEKPDNAEKQVRQEPKGNDEMPSWAKALTDEISNLRQRIATDDKKKVIESRKTEMSAIISKLPESVKRAYGRMNLDVTEEEYESLKSSVTTEVEDMAKVFSAKRSVFNPPFAGTAEQKQEISKEKADAIAKRLANH